MARFCPLFSSSSGNCIYVGSGQSGVLIDAGVSAKRIRLSMEAMGLPAETLQGVFVTHEHTDHVAGVRVLCSQLHLPLYASPGTLSALEAKGVLTGGFPVYPVEEEGIEAGDCFVRPFATSHDSAQSTDYTIQLPDDRKAAVVTDLGVVTPGVMEQIQGSDLILLESNHDVRTLQNGPYPYPLKRRILSDRGHLSNEVCSQTAVQLLRGGTTRFILGHLSRENNTPEMAYQHTYAAFCEEGAQAGIDYQLAVARPADAKEVVLF